MAVSILLSYSIIVSNTNIINMKEQQFSNHQRFHPLFHFFVAPLSLLLSILSLLMLTHSFTWYGLLLAMAFICLYLTLFITRTYAKQNQDRIIRSEIRLRYFMITGKDFSNIEEQLSLAQLVALRFAHDEDFIQLTASADLPGLSPEQIKKSLKSWKADHLRV